MKKYRGTAIALSLIYTLVSLTACGQAPSEVPKETQSLPTGMEQEAVIDYKVPEALPGILADQAGYQTEGEKVAKLRGQKLPTEFRLIEEDTQKTVYTGEITDVVYDSSKEIANGFADFSEWKKAGTYRLECDMIGQSYSFVIQNDIYQVLFEQVYEDMVQKLNEVELRTLTDEQEKQEAYRRALALLAVYEFYPEVCTDENSDGIPDVLHEVTGMVKQMLSLQERSEEALEGPLYSAVLAKFSYLYQKYDVKYATECLQAASGAFSLLQDEMQKQGNNFLALTELYRATGKAEYRKQIGTYKELFRENSNLLKENEYLLGMMTYLMTRQRVDVDFCNLLMEQLRDNGEKVAEETAVWTEQLQAPKESIEELLEKATGLSFANYVLSNYKYGTMLEDFQHYLMGQNEEAKCFYPAEGADRVAEHTLAEQAQTQTCYLLLLGQLADRYAKAEQIRKENI